MWSDQPAPAQQEEWIAALRRVLPPPDPEAADTILELDPRPAPEQVASLLRDEPGFVWLDGAGSRHMLFRRPLVTLTSNGVDLHVNSTSRDVNFTSSDVNFASRSLDGLDAALRAWTGPAGAFLVGWIGYEVAAELEQLDLAPPRDTDLPRLHFALYDSALIAAADGRWSLVSTDAWRTHDASKSLDLLHLAADLALTPPSLGEPFAAEPADFAQGRAAFADGVARLVRRIHAGDLFQTNLCRHLRVPLASEVAWPLYRRMRALSPATHGAFIRVDGQRAILSVSPETFLTLRDGHVESLPIKGTRPRGRSAEEDAALRRDLLESTKDRAELAMVVDVTRNDLSRVCVPGSVQVAKHASPMTLPTLHHTCSRVTGRLRDGSGAADLLRAAFPPASITGAPKIAAMQAAFREERANRGPCMGAIGWISLDGAMELSVAIRTAYTSGGEAVYLAGCGITAESDPEAELAESDTKAAAFMAALGLRI